MKITRISNGYIVGDPCCEQTFWETPEMAVLRIYEILVHPEKLNIDKLHEALNSYGGSLYAKIQEG